MINKTETRIIEVLQKWRDTHMSALTLRAYYDLVIDCCTTIVKVVEEAIDISDGSLRVTNEWVEEARDFVLLMRDGILHLVREEQYSLDERYLTNDHTTSLFQEIGHRSSNLLVQFSNAHDRNEEIAKLKFEKSPLPEYKQQLKDLHKHIIKIYESRARVEDLRNQLLDYRNDFQDLVGRQKKNIDDLFDIVHRIKNIINTHDTSTYNENATSTIDELGHIIHALERMQGNDKMELLAYPHQIIMSVPVDVKDGILLSKTVNIHFEVSRWMSSRVFPYLIDLENREELALERTIEATNQVKNILLATDMSSTEGTKSCNERIDRVLDEIDVKYLKPLLLLSEENISSINIEFYNHFYASKIYSNRHNFLPAASAQINDISRFALKRATEKLSHYKSFISSFVLGTTSKYLELERVSSTFYINNKLNISADDERLSLFLKKGFIGRSFTVKREKLQDKVVQRYRYWSNNFLGNILVTGGHGMGKSTLLGVCSQGLFDKEVVTIHPGEASSSRRFSQHISFDLKEVVESVLSAYRGERIVLMIDDIELWHNHDIPLYDNLLALEELIKMHRDTVFFVVACNWVTIDRWSQFSNIDSLFAERLEMSKMSNADIKKALLLRSQALPELGLTDDAHDNNVGDILREAKGNVGAAFIEYCRYFNTDYLPNIHSIEFHDLVMKHKALFEYFLSRGFVFHKNENSTILEEDIMLLKGQKLILENWDKGLYINPLLIHNIENIINKI